MVDQEYEIPIGAEGSRDRETQTENAAGEEARRMEAEARRMEAEAQEKGYQLKEQAYQRTRGLVDDQKEQAARKIAGAATALKETSRNLHEQHQDMVARYADLIGQRFDSLSGYLSGKDVEEIFQDAEEMIRSRPGMFLGGAFALGVFAARFMKASGGSAQLR